MHIFLPLNLFGFPHCLYRLIDIQTTIFSINFLVQREKNCFYIVTAVFFSYDPSRIGANIAKIFDGVMIIRIDMKLHY
jgi:hypothetical protein